MSSSNLSLFLLVDLDTRVAGALRVEGGPHLGETMSIFEEDNVAFVLNELKLKRGVSC